MSTVQQYLHRLRKAELQTIHQFWLPGESVQSTRDELAVRVGDVLVSGAGIEERVGRLSRIQCRMLTTLLLQAGYGLETRELTRRLEADGAARVEVESSARMLVERGFIERLRLQKKGRKSAPGQEQLVVPEELAEHLKQALEVDSTQVSPADQLSQKRLPFEIDFDGTPLEERIEALEDRHLGELVRIAVAHRGIAEPETPGVPAVLADAPGDEGLARKEWRSALEDAGIGTIGAVSLRDFGILVQQPAVIIFQEWVGLRSREALHRGEVPDIELEAGVDLFIDVERVASRIERQPARLTRGGRVPKRLAESLRSGLYLSRLEDHIDGDSVQRALVLGMRLGIIESFAEHLRVHDERLRRWRKLDLVRQVEILLQKFLDESQGDRWSFHQEALRQILLDILVQESPEGWVSLDALVALAVSTYVLELEERDVRSALRQRREEDFAREKLQSTFHRLGADLLYWIVNRMLLLGMCELGSVQGRLTSFRLTSLGKEILGIDRAPRECRILVNPDFEIILFSEGLRGMRLELQLSRFGSRLSAERIRRYRVTRDSIRRGIRTGLAVQDVVEILADASSHPVPEPVRVSIRDWGRDLDWIVAQPALLLSGLRPDRRRELVEFLEERELPHRTSDDGGIVLTGPATRSEGAGSPDILDELRDAGWLVREERGGELQLDSQTGARS